MQKVKQVAKDQWGWLAVVLGGVVFLGGYVETLPESQGTQIAATVIATVGLVRELLKKLGYINGLPKK